MEDIPQAFETYPADRSSFPWGLTLQCHESERPTPCDSSLRLSAQAWGTIPTRRHWVNTDQHWAYLHCLQWSSGEP